jgi:hypothetical protein
MLKFSHKHTYLIDGPNIQLVLPTCIQHKVRIGDQCVQALHKERVTQRGVSGWSLLLRFVLVSIRDMSETLEQTIDMWKYIAIQTC